MEECGQRKRREEKRRERREEKRREEKRREEKRREEKRREERRGEERRGEERRGEERRGEERRGEERRGEERRREEKRGEERRGEERRGEERRGEERRGEERRGEERRGEKRREEKRREEKRREEKKEKRREEKRREEKRREEKRREEKRREEKRREEKRREEKRREEKRREEKRREEKRREESLDSGSDDITKISKAAKIMERMVNQNTFDDIAQDFKYFEDASDEYRDQQGTLLPLWKFQYDKTKRLAVTAISWNPKYKDLFAVGYGSSPVLRECRNRAVPSPCPGIQAQEERYKLKDVNNFFLISNLNLPYFSLKPLPLTLPLDSLIKTLSPSFLMYIPASTAYAFWFRVSVWLRGLDLAKLVSCIPCLTSCTSVLRAFAP
ncbi:hypothetical protein QYF61_024540 [Mycteria americana]|uniref:Uncharacterized protein n=1 Tax=Mycteria americana TaxID=33587 RepID=A0AAN7MVI0_MYCAM|nr:hypothetical protein QYF61_024540 [Mycteria americana]